MAHNSTRQMTFQSTPPHGERRGFINHAKIGVLFQSTPRTGSDTICSSATTEKTAFQSTPPHGERPKVEAHVSDALLVRFNPRPRTGSDLGAGPCVLRWCEIVSIHAPARGATRTCLGWTKNEEPTVSIHAPARGATLCRVRSLRSWCSLFQSTPPHGERLSISAVGQPAG